MITLSPAGLRRALLYAESALSRGDVPNGLTIVQTLLSVLDPSGPAPQPDPGPHLSDAGRPMSRAAKPGGAEESTQDTTRPAQGGEPPAANPADDYPGRILARFGGCRATSKAIGVHYSTVFDWKRAQHIPARRQAELLAAAQRLGIALSPADFFADSLPAPEAVRWSDDRKARATAYATTDDVNGLLADLNAMPGLPVNRDQLSAYCINVLRLHRPAAARDPSPTPRQVLTADQEPIARAGWREPITMDALVARVNAAGPAVTAGQLCGFASRRRLGRRPTVPKSAAAAAQVPEPIAPPAPQAEAAPPPSGPPPIPTAEDDEPDEREVFTRLWTDRSLTMRQVRDALRAEIGGAPSTDGGMYDRARLYGLPTNRTGLVVTDASRKGGSPGGAPAVGGLRAPMDERDRLEARVQLRKGRSAQDVAFEFGQPVSDIEALLDNAA